jgi:hypothetical protein
MIELETVVVAVEKMLPLFPQTTEFEIVVVELLMQSRQALVEPVELLPEKEQLKNPVKAPLLVTALPRLERLPENSQFT